MRLEMVHVDDIILCDGTQFPKGHFLSAHNIPPLMKRIDMMVDALKNGNDLSPIFSYECDRVNGKYMIYDGMHRVMAFQKYENSVDIHVPILVLNIDRNKREFYGKMMSNGDFDEGSYMKDLEKKYAPMINGDKLFIDGQRDPEKRYKQIKKALTPGRWIDFGSGTGAFSVLMAKDGLKVTSIESDPSECWLQRKLIGKHCITFDIIQERVGCSRLKELCDGATGVLFLSVLHHFSSYEEVDRMLSLDIQKIVELPTERDASALGQDIFRKFLPYAEKLKKYGEVICLNDPEYRNENDRDLFLIRR